MIALTTSHSWFFYQYLLGCTVAIKKKSRVAGVITQHVEHLLSEKINTSLRQRLQLLNRVKKQTNKLTSLTSNDNNIDYHCFILIFQVKKHGSWRAITNRNMGTLWQSWKSSKPVMMKELKSLRAHSWGTTTKFVENASHLFHI